VLRFDKWRVAQRLCCSTREGWLLKSQTVQPVPLPSTAQRQILGLISLTAAKAALGFLIILIIAVTSLLLGQIVG
jgi:hypothetical protein